MAPPSADFSTVGFSEVHWTNSSPAPARRVLSPEWKRLSIECDGAAQPEVITTSEYFKSLSTTEAAGCKISMQQHVGAVGGWRGWGQLWAVITAVM